MGVGEHEPKSSVGRKEDVSSALHPNLLEALLLTGTRIEKCTGGGAIPDRMEI